MSCDAAREKENEQMIRDLYWILYGDEWKKAMKRDAAGRAVRVLPPPMEVGGES